MPITLAFGAFDYGRAYVEEVRMNGAARAGAERHQPLSSSQPT